jgi:hypothetical protein
VRTAKTKLAKLGTVFASAVTGGFLAAFVFSLLR